MPLNTSPAGFEPAELPESPHGLERDWEAPAGGWPSWLWTVPYVGAHHPGARDSPEIERGANCQRYAYAVLSLFGLHVPALRSSELWADTTATVPVAPGELAPHDLVLFGPGSDAWGAHIGVLMGAEDVLHLCAEVGRPAVWSFADFTARDRYATVVGAKRVHSSAAAPSTPLSAALSPAPSETATDGPVL